MRFIFYFLFFILCVSVAVAIYSGENATVHLAKCESLSVFVSGEYAIDENEFMFYGCNKSNQKNWICNCTDNYDLIMGIGSKTINNYTLTLDFSYYSQEEDDDDGDSGSSGSGGGANLIPKCNYTECINNQTIKMCISGTYRYNQTLKCVPNITLSNLTLTEPFESITASKDIIVPTVSTPVEIKPEEIKPQETSKVWIFIVLWAVVMTAVVFLILHFKKP